jgi:membrane protease YdiL (CAAX protease family)
MANLMKSATGVSFLLILILSLLFLYSQSFSTSWIFPENVDLWNNVLTGYLLIFAISLIGAFILNREAVQNLAKADYWSTFFKRFVPVAIVTIIILILVKGVLKGTGSINLLSALGNINISILVFHLFIVSQVEELLFGGLIFTSFQKKLGLSTAYIVTAILFSVWHFSKSGGSFVMLFTYFPLRLGFDYIRNYGFPGLNKLSPTLFGPTPQTQQANAGAHFAWNAFIVIFMNTTRI